MTKRFEFTGEDVLADLRDRYGYTGDLAQIFATNRDYEVNKWHHYIPLYDRYLNRFRGRAPKMLEIGVGKGGGLQMWRRFLGDDAVIYGVDIREDCAEYDGVFAEVRIGSQTDAEFLNAVIDEMGGVDIILDDGSHKMPHIEASLRALFPRLADDGLYLIEDLHAAYWTGSGGGVRAPENFFNTVRAIIDDMHKPYHNRDVQVSELAPNVSGVHVHDSLVVIEKGQGQTPCHSRVA